MNLKQQAAEFALQFVKSGMFLGLGTGSTTAYFIQALGERLAAGTLQDIQAVPTSTGTAAKAKAAGIPLTTLADLYHQRKPPLLDLAVDGADEVDPDLNVIKGLGRALLREKIVEIQTDHFIVIVDEFENRSPPGNTRSTTGGNHPIRGKSPRAVAEQPGLPRRIVA